VPRAGPPAPKVALQRNGCTPSPRAETASACKPGQLRHTRDPSIDVADSAAVSRHFRGSPRGPCKAVPVPALPVCWSTAARHRQGAHGACPMMPPLLLAARHLSRTLCEPLLLRYMCLTAPGGLWHRLPCAGLHHGAAAVVVPRDGRLRHPAAGHSEGVPTMDCS
jgi:hypothetical protein